jgi:hypothetical protein
MYTAAWGRTIVVAYVTVSRFLNSHVTLELSKHVSLSQVLVRLYTPAVTVPMGPNAFLMRERLGVILDPTHVTAKMTIIWVFIPKANKICFTLTFCVIQTSGVLHFIRNFIYRYLVYCMDRGRACCKESTCTGHTKIRRAYIHALRANGQSVPVMINICMY